VEIGDMMTEIGFMWWGMWWKGYFEHETDLVPASPFLFLEEIRYLTKLSDLIIVG